MQLATAANGIWIIRGKETCTLVLMEKSILFGAEKGYWRIDQDAASYQGWGGLYAGKYERDQSNPEKFPTIGYEDTNGDGFFNLIKFDMDGDTLFEQSFNL